MEFIQINGSDLNFSDSFLQGITDQINEKGEAQVSMADMQQAYLRFQTSIYTQLLTSKNGFDKITFSIATTPKVFKLVLARVLGKERLKIARGLLDDNYKIC